MSRTTRVTPRCAVHCAERIDLHPSRRLAAWAFAWLAVLGVLVLSSSLPIPACVASWGLVAMGYAACVRRAIALRGGHAVRALGWSEDGTFLLWAGAGAMPRPAEIMDGSFRLGSWLLVLTLRTGAGRLHVLLDAGVHEAAQFRRLCRRLEWPPGTGSSRVRRPS
jgi:hypothetical protein